MSIGLWQTGQAILLGGLAAGALDFIGACITAASRGVTPLRIAQSIASGLLGAQDLRVELLEIWRLMSSQWTSANG